MKHSHTVISPIILSTEELAVFDTLEGFSGSELHAGDFEYDFPCTECQKHGLNSEAVYFCQQCTRQFCGPCLKQHDQFYRGHPILGPRKRDLWGNVTSMCKLHPGEEMKVFCRDHRQTCCVLCLEELHRQCKQVKLLQHIAPKPTNQPESENNEKTTHNDELPLKLKERVATTKHDTSPVVTAIHNNRPYPVKEGNCFNVKLEHDRYPCRIYGITVLPSGEIVITDHYNCNVKLLSPNYAVMDHFSTVIQKPWDICAVSDNQVAACTEGREILFFNVKNSKLELDRKMPLDVCCYCIYSVSYMAGHLYLSSGHTLYQYTLAGQKVREINLSNGLFAFRLAVNPDADRLYIVETTDHQLVTLNMKGRVLARLKNGDQKGATDVCVSPGGEVFVCGFGTHTILQVASKGKRKLATLAIDEDGEATPTTLTFAFDTLAAMVCSGLEPFNKFWLMTTQGTFLSSFIKI
ncbi:uncharacterized protein LOC128207737 [Mya arenaria]|uniref:uncharacterized protein LOC128207737 n=1 Tax=Mya arenaria TaxID=6604 RepID=UPI0022E92DF3|nr:uncharacterized protein LOC128207737 [Mya arenaria]